MIPFACCILQIDGLVQDCSISNVLAVEILSHWMFFISRWLVFSDFLHFLYEKFDFYTFWVFSMLSAMLFLWPRYMVI